jgi:hypothetical protein
MTSPLLILLTVWSAAAALLVMGIVRYDDVQLLSEGAAFLTAANAAFALGYLLTKAAASSLPRRPRLLDPQAYWAGEAKRDRLSITCLAAAGILASGLFAVEMLVFKGIDPFDILSTREAYLTMQVGPLSRIAAVLGAGGFVGLTAAVLLWEHISGAIRLICLVAAASLIAFSVLSAGRQTILQLILVGIFAAAIRRQFVTRERLPRTLRMSFVVCFVGIVLYGGFAAGQRNAIAVRMSKKEMLERLFGVRFSPALDVRLDEMPGPVRDGVAEALVYVTHPIPNFVVFWSVPNRPGPFYGLWEQPFVARRLYELGLVDTTVDFRLESVLQSFRSSGRFELIFQTAVRDLVIDFGALGTLVMMSVFGACGAFALESMKREPSVPNACLLIWCDVACAYSVLLPVISDTLMFMFLIMTMLLIVKGSLGRRRGTRTRRVGLT